VASWSLGRALKGLWQKETVDESTWEELEDALLVADAGVDYAESLWPRFVLSQNALA